MAQLTWEKADALMALVFDPPGIARTWPVADSSTDDPGFLEARRALQDALGQDLYHRNTWSDLVKYLWDHPRFRMYCQAMGTKFHALFRRAELAHFSEEEAKAFPCIDGRGGREAIRRHWYDSIDTGRHRLCAQNPHIDEHLAAERKKYPGVPFEAVWCERHLFVPFGARDSNAWVQRSLVSRQDLEQAYLDMAILKLDASGAPGFVDVWGSWCRFARAVAPPRLGLLSLAALIDDRHLQHHQSLTPLTIYNWRYPLYRLEAWQHLALACASHKALRDHPLLGSLAALHVDILDMAAVDDGEPPIAAWLTRHSPGWTMRPGDNQAAQLKRAAWIRALSASSLPGLLLAAPVAAPQGVKRKAVE